MKVLRGENLLRVAVACVAAILMAAGAVPVSWWGAYAAVGFAVVYGLALASFIRPGATLFSGAPLLRLALDAGLVALLTAGTGGAGSPFYGLFLVAALGIIRLRTPAQMVAGVGTLATGYAGAVAGVAPAALLSPAAGMGAALIVLISALAAGIGTRLRTEERRMRETLAALDSERTYGRMVAAQAAADGELLAVLGIEGALEWAAGTARASVDARYAHAALLKGPNRTSVKDEGDGVLPTSWHPVVHGLVLESGFSGEAAFSEASAHGVEGFLAVPVCSGRGERLGALVVGGRRFGAEERRALEVVASRLGNALQNAENAPGGRDPTTGLPNHGSLGRSLDPTGDRAPEIAAVRLNGLYRYARTHGFAAADALVGRFASLLAKQGRAFRISYAEFALLISGQDTLEAVVESVGRHLSDDGVAASAVPVTVAPDGEALAALDAAFAALGEAEHPLAGVAGAGRMAGTAAKAALPELEGTGLGRHTMEAAAALLAAAEAHEPELGPHMRAVAGVTRSVGIELGIQGAELDELTVGALLHDIGKIGVPVSVLRKPGLLDEDESAFIEEHPIVGAGIVEKVGDLSCAVLAVRHHHERYDGRGYPDGLAGREIPLAARVVFVADAFDSMVRRRPYRGALTPVQALEEILRHAGTQFDPEVARALARVISGPRRLRTTG